MSPKVRYYDLPAWECLSSIRGFLGASHNDFFSAIDATKVISIEQITIAYGRAKRLLEHSEKIKRTESAFLMLLTGEKQISRAQEEGGISSSTKSIIAVYVNEGDILEFENLCSGKLEANPDNPVPERALDMDSVVFTRMAKVELSI